jgi:FtsP/CotA-like multicopper oxidase with cupredoxin domain
MQHPIDRSRRRFVFRTSLGLLAAAGAPAWVRAMQMQSSGSLPPNRANPNFKPDVEIDMLAQPGSVNILPGQATQVWQYAATLKSGPQGTLTEIPGSYLGPLIRLQKGQKIRINFRNGLTNPTIVHWHGLHVPAVMDGHPMHVIGNGETYVYEFEVLNRAGLHIYHPHPHERLGTELYHGLAGGLVVNDEEEAKLGLPSGEYEIPVVLQDRRFDARNQLVWSDSMHDQMMGFYGDHILVNGRPAPEIEVASRAYRLRFLNGSNARIYKLGWSDGTPMTVIGTDGGLLEKPETRPYLMLAPGERLDVWADFSGRKKGTELTLRSLPFKGVLPKMAERMMHGGMGGGKGGMGGGGMMGGMGMMGAMALPVGSDYPLFKIRVTRETSDSPNLPTRLSSFKRYTLDEVANRNKPIPLGISEAPHAMLLNGRPYAYNDVQPYERVPLNSIQLLEIFHAHGGGGGHGGDGSAAGAGNHGAEAGGESKATGMAGHQTGGGMGMGRGMMGGGMMGGMGHGRMGGGGMGGMNHGGQEGGMGHGGEGQGGGMGMMGGGMMGGMGGGMMFSMAHPIHLHGQQFEIISRTIGAEETEDYATVKEGFVDSGLKDTVLVMPGEKVRLIKPFQDFRGLFVYHCHNIEHEDMGMMRDFLVE